PPEAGTIDAAGSIWPAQSLEVRPSYLDLVKRYFDAEITPLDYKADPDGAKNVINNWVSEKTKGKIRGPIGRLDPKTQMVLVSAIYFNANWMEMFPKKNTKEEPFYKADGSETKVDLMKKKNRLSYYASDDLQAVRLPYVSNAYSMLVLLPRKTGDIGNLEKSISRDTFERILQSMRRGRGEVIVFLPKFTVETKYDLTGILSNMGFKTPFSDSAQFPKLAEKPLKIDWVVHQAFVDVYEEGTTAAAVTSIGMRATSIPLPPPLFRADHPFVYFILENRTNAILFMGRYMGP
ncbi:MAG: serpin family protein, partial [Synergistaceae bacterium]|nr:serpin family protein [Synergistaceae bacterium]